MNKYIKLILLFFLFSILHLGIFTILLMLFDLFLFDYLFNTILKLSYGNFYYFFSLSFVMFGIFASSLITLLIFSKVKDKSTFWKNYIITYLVIGISLFIILFWVAIHFRLGEM